MLPFYVSKLFKAKIEGTALPQADGLRLVFHAPTEGERMFDAEVQEILVAWNTLADLTVQRGLISTTVQLTLTSADTFPRQLKPDHGKLVLEIRRADRGELEPFERAVAGFRSGDMADDTEEFIDDMRDFLDRM